MTTTEVVLLSLSCALAVVSCWFYLLSEYRAESVRTLERTADYERREKMRLYWENVALEEDSNVRTARTLREDIVLVARHRDELRETLAENVEEMDRLRSRLRDIAPLADDGAHRDDA